MQGRPKTAYFFTHNIVAIIQDKTVFTKMSKESSQDQIPSDAVSMQ